MRSDFSAKVPSVHFSLPQYNLKVQIGINNNPSSRTSALLAAYTAIDPRVARLGVALRVWAKVGR